MLLIIWKNEKYLAKTKTCSFRKKLANYMNQRARTSFNNSSVIRRGANMGMPPLTWHHWAVLHIMAEMLGYWVFSLVYQYEIEFFPILQKFWIMAIYQKRFTILIHRICIGTIHLRRQHVLEGEGCPHVFWSKGHST